MSEHEHPDDNALSERIGLKDELLAAARQVIARWEKGDLAGAVRDLARVVSEIDAFDAEQERA